MFLHNCSFDLDISPCDLYLGREAHKAQIDSKTRAQKWQCSKTEKEIRETFFGLNYDLQHP